MLAAEARVTWEQWSSVPHHCGSAVLAPGHQEITNWTPLIRGEATNCDHLLYISVRALPICAIHCTFLSENRQSATKAILQYIGIFLWLKVSRNLTISHSFFRPKQTFYATIYVAYFNPMERRRWPAWITIFCEVLSSRPILMKLSYFHGPDSDGLSVNGTKFQSGNPEMMWRGLGWLACLHTNHCYCTHIKFRLFNSHTINTL